ncbi:MAG TPA: tetratricopeptide repeat protein [Candidatus Binatia bacterium]|nr:tetratricopeptide repeat protein [Candidatus Binatia bacterium]
MKSLLTLLVLAFSFLLLRPQTAAMDIPEAKPNENPNMEAGRKALEAKDFKAAVGHFTKAVEAEPKNADAHSLLGYSYRKDGIFEKSMEFYQRALKLDGNHRGAHEYLGELYLEMNQLDNAEKQLAALKRACPWVGKCEEYEDLKKAVDEYKAKKK